MNKALKEALFRQKVRKIHRLSARRRISESQDTLYTVFVQPFTDVLDAVGLAGQDILNSVVLNLELLSTISPKKMDAALQSFDERKAKIAEKWKPIMERTQDALSGTDADMLALVFAPHLFLATAALEKSYAAAGNLSKALGDAGLKIPFASAILGYTPDERPSPRGRGGSGGKEKGILGKMMTLFYIESTWLEGELLVEQEKDKSSEQQESAPSLDDALKNYLEVTGLSDQFEKDKNEMLDTTLSALKDPENSILPEGILQLGASRKLSKAQDFEEFSAVFEMAKAEGLDLQATGLDKLKKEMEESIEKLMSSDDFKRQVGGMAQDAKSGASQQSAADSAQTEEVTSEAVSREKTEKSTEGRSQRMTYAELMTPLSPSQTSPIREDDEALFPGKASSDAEKTQEVPEIPEDKLRKAAEKVSFTNAAQNLKDQLTKSIPQLEQQLTDYLQKVSPAPGTLEIIASDSRGAEIVELINNYKKKISG